MLVKLTAIKRTPRIAKATGKPFVSVGIRTNVHEERWLSGFANPENADWEVGDEVTIEVEEKGEYLNFKNGAPKREDQGPAANNPATQELKNLITLKVIPLLLQIDANVKKMTGTPNYPQPDDEAVPF